MDRSAASRLTVAVADTVEQAQTLRPQRQARPVPLSVPVAGRGEAMDVE